MVERSLQRETPQPWKLRSQRRRRTILPVPVSAKAGVTAGVTAGVSAGVTADGRGSVVAKLDLNAMSPSCVQASERADEGRHLISRVSMHGAGLLIL